MSAAAKALELDIAQGLYGALDRASRRGDKFDEEDLSVAIMRPVARAFKSVKVDPLLHFASAIVMGSHGDFAKAREAVDLVVSTLDALEKDQTGAEALGAELLHGH